MLLFFGCWLASLIGVGGMHHPLLAVDALLVLLGNPPFRVIVFYYILSCSLHVAGARLRPDFLLWVSKALLVKGEEKKSAGELADAVKEITSKMTSTWDDKVYGKCLYMFAYAVAGYMLEIYAVQ